MNNKYLVLLLTVALFPNGIMAQNLPIFNVKQVPDTIIPLKKKPWQAAAEVAGLNVGVWAFDRYVLKGDYAYISLNSMKNNLKSGFYWDNDSFLTNLFGHPYQGSLYFDAARSNGMNFWESSLYTAGGSLMWEIFMENEHPSINDFISTTIGGTALGEAFYRTSDIFFDNRATGWNRFGRELLGTIFAPGRGLTRIINGESWKRSRYSGNQSDHSDTYFEISAGIKATELFDLNRELIDEGLGGVIEARVKYGDLYEESEKPFDCFLISVSFNLQKNQPLIGQADLMAKLWSRRIYNDSKKELHFGVFQHFDYYSSDTLSRSNTSTDTKMPYEIGVPASFGIGLFGRGHNTQNTFTYFGQIHTSAILLGSSLSDYFHDVDRNYNFGSGFSGKLAFGCVYKKKIGISAVFESYDIFTWKGYVPGKTEFDKDSNVQGDKSRAYYNLSNIKITYRFNDIWSIYLRRYDYFRKTNYEYLPDVKSHTSETSLMVTYEF